MKQVLFLLVLVVLAGKCPGQVRISQIYGGGGNSGSTFTHDFVEILNTGSSPVDLAGWSLQYASATGGTWQGTPLAGMIHPSRYFLIQEAPGGGGSVALPIPDVTGSIAMSATAGKVALVNSPAALAGVCPLGPSVVDFVGFGSTASCFEGSAPAPGPGSTQSVHRREDGKKDSGDNGEDFVVGLPNPRNSASAPLSVSGRTSELVHSGLITVLCNSPNPFNPSTRIYYSVSQPGPVRLSLCNVLGQHIRTIVESHHESGLYELYFDGAELPSGMYACVMETRKQVRTHLMMLLR